MAIRWIEKAKARVNSIHKLQEPTMHANDSRLLRRHRNDNLALCRISNTFRVTENVYIF